MVKINKLDENLNIEGKRVLLRVDFNVPINEGTITEDSRIEKVLPTIKFLINKKAKIIIIAHLGRPKGKIVPELTLKPIAKKLSDYLNRDVVFLNKSICHSANNDDIFHFFYKINYNTRFSRDF